MPLEGYFLGPGDPPARKFPGLLVTTRVTFFPSKFRSIFRPPFFRLLPPKRSPTDPKILPKSTKKHPSGPSRHEPPKIHPISSISDDFRKCRCASRGIKTNRNQHFFYRRLVPPATEKTSETTPKSSQNPTADPPGGRYTNGPGCTA